MNIIIAGGGTGGHVFPALAIARMLKKTLPGVCITFVGTVRGIEAKIIPREGYDLKFIRSEGLVGKDLLKTLRSMIKIPISMMDSFGILKNIKPELVIGVGGYSSGPFLLCAKLKGIPTLIHEQNTIPGLANKMLGKLVDTVAVTYHESIKYFSQDNVYLTGNPVREEILNGDREKGYEVFSLDRDLFTIFVFGGSLGASHINEAAGEALTYLEPLKEKIQFLHQTGEEDLDKMKELYSSRGFKGTVVAFAHQMADAYAVADIVISRAGATTLAELTACGKAAILIPFPYSAGNHQELNARKLWDMGAAELLFDRDLDGKKLFDMISFLIEDPDALSEMERISRSLGNRGATAKVVELIMGLLKKKS